MKADGVLSGDDLVRSAPLHTFTGPLQSNKMVAAQPSCQGGVCGTRPLGSSVVLTGSGMVGPEDFSVLTVRLQNGKLVADLFDPQPSDDKEKQDIADYVASLKKGTRKTDAAIHKYLSGLFGKIDFFPTSISDDSLGFSFRGAEGPSVVSVRQSGKTLYVLCRTYLAGDPVFRFSVLPLL